MVVRGVDIPILEEYQRNEPISQQAPEGYPEELDPEEEFDPDEDQQMDGYEADTEDNLDDEGAGPEVELDPDEEEGTGRYEQDTEEEAGPALEGQRNVLHEPGDASEDVMDGVFYNGREIQFLVAMVETFPSTVDEL